MGRLNAEKFQNFHFEACFRDFIENDLSDNRYFRQIFCIYIFCKVMAKTRKFTLVIIVVTFPQKWQFRLKIKVLKFLRIQPIQGPSKFRILTRNPLKLISEPVLRQSQPIILKNLTFLRNIFSRMKSLFFKFRLNTRNKSQTLLLLIFIKFINFIVSPFTPVQFIIVMISLLISYHLGLEKVAKIPKKG